MKLVDIDVCSTAEYCVEYRVAVALVEQVLSVSDMAVYYSAAARFEQRR
jgi:hypothetical protein